MESGRARRIGYSNISEFGGDVDILRGFVYDSYIHSGQAFGSEGISGCDPLPNPIPYRCYNHSNGFGIDRGHYITLQHNTILMPRIPGADSAVELDDDLGTISHVTVTDNFIAGGGYCTYAASSPSLAPSTYIVYTENAFSTMYYGTCAYYGPVAYWSSRAQAISGLVITGQMAALRKANRIRGLDGRSRRAFHRGFTAKIQSALVCGPGLLRSPPKELNTGGVFESAGEPRLSDLGVGSLRQEPIRASQFRWAPAGLSRAFIADREGRCPRMTQEISLAMVSQ